MSATQHRPVRLPTAHLPRATAQALPLDIANHVPTLNLNCRLPTERFRLHHLDAGIGSGEVPDFLPIRLSWHVVGFVLKGETRVNWRWGRREVRRTCRPGSVTITVAGDEHEVRCVGKVELMFWGIDPEFLRSVAERELERPCPALELLALQGGVDDRLWELGRRMAAELHAPRYASQLYFETLTTQLAICLVRDHCAPSARSRGMRPRHPVDDQRIRQAIDYIHANLAWTITLEELAAEAGLSAGYFVTAFRQATGLPPHRYVLAQRVERAKVLLAEPGRTISQIALDVGFSSQSHLTAVFRRLSGLTPNRYRDQALGL
jgi:AraC family transcriptional regulator